jgi:hypothetical protein
MSENRADTNGSSHTSEITRSSSIPETIKKNISVRNSGNTPWGDMTTFWTAWPMRSNCSTLRLNDVEDVLEAVFPLASTITNATSKQDIQCKVAQLPGEIILCEGFRRAYLDEEGPYDTTHKDLCKASERILLDRKNLIEILAFSSYIPVGYEAFYVCPCGIFAWDYNYVLPVLREKGYGLAVARAALELLKENLGEGIMIESAYHVKNKVARAIHRYAGFQPTYITGVATIERILIRRRDL